MFECGCTNDNIIYAEYDYSGDIVYALCIHGNVFIKGGDVCS